MRTKLSIAAPIAGVVALALAWLTPSIALADEDTRPLDAIRLKNGETLHGRVTDLAPEDHATITVNGEVLMLSWWEVEAVDLGKAPVEPRPAPPPEPAPSAPIAPLHGPRVLVHITSPGVVLYRRAAGSTEFVKACESACDVELPLEDTYKMGGNGITPTKEFQLRGRPGQRVELSVDATSWFGVVTGGVVTAAGGLSSYLGVANLVSSGINRSAGLREAGLAASVLGAALLGTGFYIVLRSMETDLAQRTPKRGSDASVRAPSWRTASEVPLPRTTFPLLLDRSF